MMKKMINKPEDFVNETVEGIIAAYEDRVRLLNEDVRMLVTNTPVPKAARVRGIAGKQRERRQKRF